MSKIDLAIKGVLSRQPSTAAGQRNARLWLCMLLLVADMAALATGFAFGLRAAGLQWLADGQWQPLAGGMIVYAVLAFHNQAYNPHCLMPMTQSCRRATMALDRKSVV